MEREELLEVLEQNEAVVADGFEDALIGYVERAVGMGPVALYDKDKCIQILMERDGMDYEGALECVDFNVIQAWVGQGTPAFATLLCGCGEATCHPSSDSRRIEGVFSED